MKITVTTPTGHIGGALAGRLLDSGAEVTLLARNPAKVVPFAARGANVVEGNQTDPEAIRRALRGADALFWLTPPDYRADNLRRRANELADALIDALGARPSLRVVNLSSVGAQWNEGTGPVKGLHDTEHKLDASGARVTHLRAGYFMENFLFSLGTITGQGAIYSTVPGTVATRHVATRDIAEAAAQLLLDPAADAKVVNIFGPEETSFDRAAEILSQAAGSPIAYIQAPPEAVRAGALQSGLSEDFAGQFLELESAMTNGLLAPEPRYSSRYGKTTLTQFAREVFAPALIEAGYKPKQS